MVLLAVLWVLSPLVLIPMVISRSSRLKKAERFLDQLLNSGRISSSERFTGNVENMPGYGAQGQFGSQYGQFGAEQGQQSGGWSSIPKPEGSAFAQDSSASAADNSPTGGFSYIPNTSASEAEKKAEQLRVSSQPAENKAADTEKAPFAEQPKTAESGFTPPPADNGFTPPPADNGFAPPPVQNGFAPNYAQPQFYNSFTQPKKHDSGALLFGIGVTFVILAGFIFSTAIWVYLGSWARVGVIAVAAAVFFGLSGMADKKFKIKNTSAAFYILGSVFASIAFITAGWFELFGEWLSVKGDGHFLFFALALLVVALFTSNAVRLYHFDVCVYFSLGSGVASVTLLLAQFSSTLTGSPQLFVLLANIFGMLALALYRAAGEDNNKSSKPAENVLLLARVAYYVMGVVLLIATFIDDFTGESKWSVYGWLLCLLFIGELTYISIKNKSQGWLCIQCVPLMAAVIQVALVVGDYAPFVLGLTVAGMAATFIYELLKKNKMLIFKADGVNVGMRIIFAIITMPVLWIDISERASWSTSSWGVALLYAAELAYLGISKKNKIMLALQSTMMLIVCGGVSAALENAGVEPNTTLFVFGLLLASLALVYRYVKPVSNLWGDVLFTVMMILSAISLLDDAPIPYGLVLMTIAEVQLAVVAFDKEHKLSLPVRLLLPVPMIIIADNIGGFMERELDGDYIKYAYMICAVLFICISFMFSAGIKEDKRFAQLKYSLDFFTGWLLIITASGIYDTALPSVIILTMALISYGAVQLSLNNILSAMPVISVYAAVYGMTSTLQEDILRRNDMLVMISIAMCIIFTLLSRIFYGKGFSRTEGGKKHFDTLLVGVLFSPFLAVNSGEMFSFKACHFIMLLELTVFFADLYRKNNSRTVNMGALTVAAAMLGIALMDRPFMVVDDNVMSFKVILLIITAFGFAVKRIWKENEKASLEFSSAVFMTAYVLLLFDALINQTLFNSLLVLSVSLVILLYSFMAKRKRWFLSSAIGLVGLTLYIMKDFLAEISWWVYLLLAGILLIYVASANEYLKGKNNDFKHRAGRFFEEWKW